MWRSLNMDVPAEENDFIAQLSKMPSASEDKITEIDTLG